MLDVRYVMYDDDGRMVWGRSRGMGAEDNGYIGHCVIGANRTAAT